MPALNLPQINTEIVIYALILIIIILIVWLILLERRLNRLLLGKNARTLEDSISWLRHTLEEMMKFKDDSIDYFKNVESRLKRSIQAVETVRFNPFQGTGSGGNQSFSTAFINEKGDGVVISTLHSRDRMTIFSKPIKKFSSEFDMTEEEKNVLDQAKNKVSIPNERKNS